MKKIIAVTVFFVWGFGYCNAQYVLIPDSNFVKYLKANFGSCMNGNQLDTTSPSIVHAETVDCFLKQISDLNGIQYFDNLKILYCSYNLLTSLPKLPEGLTFLDCTSDSITSLPALPASLTSLYCWNNKLTGLPSLPAGLTALSCSNNFLTSLPPLPNSLTELDCSNNPDLKCFPVLEEFNGYTFNISHTGIKCLPNSIKHPNVASFPAIDTMPVCSSTFNPNNCTLYNSVTEVSMAAISIYPNPASTTLTISSPALSLVSIVNLLGQEEVSSSKYQDTRQIIIASLPSGIYFIKLKDETGHETVSKFVKQ